MTSDFSDQEQIRFFSTAARLANRERISAVEETWLRGILERLAPGQGAEPGFPEQAVGDARGRNSLRRTNWFNGRYLTAEALSRQDVYFDQRARLQAHALMPGIAWGLGIEANQNRDQFTLQPGLAFDGVGRPILVSQAFHVSLEDLIGVSRQAPRRVVGGRREFMPCVCLTADPAGASGGSAALPAGPYLLVIEAGEVPEGKAKVTGDVCGGRHSAPCEADAWRGSFGLSLVRFPVDAPLLENLPDVWALRGSLAAYYFDVFEHPLWSRWDPEFPLDGRFARGSAPGRHEGMAIPLALLHLDATNAALFIDAWIPRRLISDPPGEDWHRSCFGMPPRAAAWARIHQFQAMLQDRTSQPISMGSSFTQAIPKPANLYALGFRHIPPIGFLPVKPEDDHHLSDKEPAGLPSRSALAREALRQGEAYFAGTNVVTYGVIALHDDDILEDLQAVINKDPLQLEPQQPGQALNLLGDSGLRARLSHLGVAGRVSLFLLTLGATLRSQGLDIDALVNRRTEVVKLIVPLQGLSRRHPLLGAIPQDAAQQAPAWGVKGSAGLAAAALAGLTPKRCLDVLPRSHVVYVKQRLVLLDLVFKMVELLQAMVSLLVNAAEQQGATANQGGTDPNVTTGFSTSYGTFDAPTAITVEDYKIAFQALCENDRQLIKTVLQQGVVQDLLLDTMVSSRLTWAQADRSQALLEQVAAVGSALPEESGPRPGRQEQALGLVADAWAAEHPDAQVLQLLAAVQPAERTLELVKRVGAAAGPVAGATVADGLDLRPPMRFASTTERQLYAGVRQRLEERPLRDVALDLPAGSLPDTPLVASLTLGDVLARSPEEAARILGGADRLDAVTQAFLRDRQAALEAACGLAGGVPAAMVATVQSEVAAGRKPAEVVDQLCQEEEAKPERDRNPELLRHLADARTLVELSGNRLDALAALRRRPEG
jgi:hypothetical protein